MNKESTLCDAFMQSATDTTKLKAPVVAAAEPMAAEVDMLAFRALCAS